MFEDVKAGHFQRANIHWLLESFWTEDLYLKDLRIGDGFRELFPE